jgi:short-subunit dehydrogenase
MDQNPVDIQGMIQTNIRPYVLFTKYATLNFLRHASEHDHKVALIHTASIASDIPMPWSGIYSSTKRFNDVFGTLVA